MTDFGDPLDTSAGIPYELFARLRAEAPVWRTGTGVWFFSLFDDVLAADHEPHVDFGLAHQRRQQVFQAILQDAVYHVGAVPFGQHRGCFLQHHALVPGGGVLRGGRDGRQHERQQNGE